MPLSMTGFARVESSHDWGNLVWEIRSVNHRYLEPHFRLPELARELEPKLRDAMRKKLSRGKVEVSFSYQLNQGDAQLQVNTELLQQLQGAISQVEQTLEQSTPVNALEVLRYPGMLAGAETDRKLLLSDSLQSFNAALEDLIDHRGREGSDLGKMIEQRLEGILEQVALVRSILPGILVAQRERLLEKLSAVKLDLDNDRLEQEMVILAQKTDVDEELDRLETHVTEVRRTLKQKGSVGRRLDFLMQELNREANTLSSKSIVTDTTQAAVELKVLIEQMREQIQNIE